jgi:hypothetical protein
MSFPSFNSSSPFLLLGSAQYVNNYIKLSFKENQAGYAFISTPIQLLKDFNSSCQVAHFNVTFSFFIRQGSSPFSSGITFQILASNSPIGRFNDFNSYGASLGMGTVGGMYVPGMLAVEFDTYKDDYFGDIDNNHVGIDLSFSPRSVLSVSLSAKSPKINLTDSKQKYAWVDYDGFTNVLYVYVSSSNVKPASAVLSYSGNLCQILRPDNCVHCRTITSAYFGFTGTTSSYYQSNDILQFKINTTWPVINPNAGTFL